MKLQLKHMTPLRRDLLSIMQSALDAVNPYTAVMRAIHLEGSLLTVGGRRYDLDQHEKVWVIGAGKAGAPMARAVEDLLDDHVAGGVVVVKYDHVEPLERVTLREAAHPVPDAAALEAGRAVLDIVGRAGEEDIVLCLLSGGGSALLEALPDPLTLDDLRRVTELLLESGASINEINTIRKHLSSVKGGQLARHAAPATVVTLVLSDVVGSPLDVIASGPTVPDESTWHDVARVVEHYGLEARLPARVRERFAEGRSGRVADTPGPDDPLFERVQVVVVGDNAQAARAARAEAIRLGYHSLILTTFLEGEAREVARFLVALGREVRSHDRPVMAPACLILGGETTVSLNNRAGPESRERPGKGGRNQEVALSAAIHLAGTRGITVATLATDGSDGPTDSAGAIVDGTTVARATRARMDAARFLARHDAYPLLDGTGDLLRSGPTHTNVNDLLFVMVEGEELPGRGSAADGGEACG